MSKRFRVAFSFAGEKRSYVQGVADILARHFGPEQVLYDRYHEAEFARDDLAFHLPGLYHNEADLIVAVLCENYEGKEWCGLEWKAIYGLLKQKKSEQVMLSRFDQVDGEGLYGLAGFVDWDQKTPTQVADLILERLATNEGRDRNYYAAQLAKRAEWPSQLPVLDWSVANHEEARQAFQQLILRESPFRILPVFGSSETGKSHLSKQFLRNGLKIPHVVSGRFDFKGSSDMDVALAAFAEQLGVTAPEPGTGVARQLAQIYKHVREIAKPTLLIFDTFESAGTSETWVKESLLVSAVKNEWLRVILVGQHVPLPFAEAWEGCSAKPIELASPTAKEWYDYGLPHKPEITLAFVEQVHSCCRGKSPLLAQLLGPFA